MSEYVNPYTTEQYARHVAAGRCPSVHHSKAYCNREAGHVGEHWAPFAQPSGPRLMTWQAADQHPRPQP